MESYWIILVCVVYFARANYTCICNYFAEVSVYEKMSNTSKNIGYIHEFECKEKLLTATVRPGWEAIAYEHKVGFVRMNPNGTSVETQVCQGIAPASDKVIPSTLPQSTMPPTPSTISKTTPEPSKTTTQSTTTPSTTSQSTTRPSLTVRPSTATISGRTELCPVALRSYAAKDGGVLGQYDASCYELVPHQHSWQYAEQDCKKKGGHLAHVSNAGEQHFLSSFIYTHYNHYTWIGLHDLNTEGHYEWVSGNVVNYTNWLPGVSSHSSQDCVYLNPHNHGYWDDHNCGTAAFSIRYSYVCQYAMNPNTMVTGTVNPHGDGDTHLCPSTVQHHASVHHGTLAQYGQSCYEFLPRYSVTWSHGESLCHQEGGHLAHISNADEQNYIQSLMLKHSPQHAVWIGLNDQANENHFTWTSGNPVTYTNWVNGHPGSASHRTRDCTLFIPYEQGHWDDVPCGQHLFLFGDVGETHPVLCQFPTAKGSPAVIIG